MSWRRIAHAGAFLAFVAALAVYGWRAVDSPLLNERLAEEQRFRRATAARLVAEPVDALLAERYWQRYPDVAGDRYFGRDGEAGPQGARAHYDKHGRVEGRIWSE